MPSDLQLLLPSPPGLLYHGLASLLLFLSSYSEGLSFRDLAHAAPSIFTALPSLPALLGKLLFILRNPVRASSPQQNLSSPLREGVRPLHHFQTSRVLLFHVTEVSCLWDGIQDKTASSMGAGAISVLCTIVFSVPKPRPGQQWPQ